ncbi:MAG TPA: hypothetical protein DEP43_08090 [Ruminococcaceae bacterium]|nr:cation transporter [Oscillospiraceae bacterium]MDD5920107.1 cation transporter [Oscillospiraceae bacterium]HAO69531.1 hypothetical protein [Oscillospiraceae bacterium]HCB65899.1 hypothetical protein [Oscillospiraceae bacterium]HCU33053.1 hypothetical protein [Oscillospiraceae bacterium]
MENRVTFTVTGLSGAGAAEKIREKLYGISGVDTVDFNREKNQLVICGMELERADLADRICDMGFEVLEG